MRKYLLTATVGLLVLVAAACGTDGADDDDIGATLVAGTEGDYPPFNFFDDDEQLAGFEIDLGEAIAEELGVELQWEARPFDTLLIELDQERFDFVIASHGITEERAQQVDFTDPHICSGGMIVSKPGGPSSAEELAGATVAVQVGTTYLDAVEEVPGVGEVSTYPSDPEAFAALLADRADVWVTDRFVALEATEERDVELEFGDLLFEERIAMAVQQGNAELLGQLNDALATLLEDGTYAELSEQWFDDDIRCES